MKTFSQIKDALSAHCRPFGCDECDYEKKIFCRDLLIKDVNEFFQNAFIGEWIPVTERLPDDCGDVIVFFLTRRHQCGRPRLSHQRQMVLSV